MASVSKLISHSELFSPKSSTHTHLRDKSIVIKYGGAALENQEFQEPTMRDIAFLQQIGAHVVVVHGGSRQLDMRMKEKRLKIKSIDGLRYTSGKTIGEAREVFSKINAEIVCLLQDKGVGAVGLLGEEDSLIEAKLKSFVTYGYVGDVKSVDVERIRVIMEQGKIPVISALGRAGNGQILNINADDVACAVASSLNADKFMFITNVEGILQNPNDPSSLLSITDDEEIEKLLQEHIMSKGMIPKIKACLGAIRNNVPVVHILSARQPRALITEITGESHYGTKLVRKETRGQPSDR